jgi:hypothetical protein
MRSRLLSMLAIGVLVAAVSAPRAVAAEDPLPIASDVPPSPAMEAPAVSPIKTFYLELSDSVRVSLRRFTFSADSACAERCGHDASVVIIDSIAKADWPHATGADVIANDDTRWPTSCARCGYAFTGSDEFQVSNESLWRGAPDGRLYTLHDAPVGATWNADWMTGDPHYCGADGRSLVVKTPGGDWMVDSRASNCTLPNDDVHKCWVRHGDPTTGDVHVDKNGVTCAAGAGSIMIGNYHGFLHHGFLTDT